MAPDLEERARMPIPVEAPGLLWLAIHGYLCLALRHPGTEGWPTRAMIEEFVAELGANLVDNGLLTPEQLAEAEDVEVHARAPAIIVPGDPRWAEPL